MEWFVQHGADAAQGLVLIGVLVAFGVAWKLLGNAISWLEWETETARFGIALLRADLDLLRDEHDALKTRVKSLEAAAERIKKRSTDKATVRVAKVA
jgi:hypothetical protein